LLLYLVCLAIQYQTTLYYIRPWVVLCENIISLPFNNLCTSVISFINLHHFSVTEFEDILEKRKIGDKKIHKDMHDVVHDSQSLLESKLSVSENYEKRQRLCVILKWICFSAMVYHGIISLIATLLIITNLIDITNGLYFAFYILFIVWYESTQATIYFTKLNSPSVNVLME